MLLEVKNLSVSLDRKKVIKNLTFSMEQGDIITILGPNGSGKSVLLRTLLGFLPYEGEIIWHKKPKIGYLPQGLTQLKVKNYPLMVKDFFALKNPMPANIEINHYLNLVGLGKEVSTKVIGTLSGGQFQRLLIAWVLIAHPEMIFMDEPTTGIDIGGGETIYSLLHQIKQNEKLTIFLVTHDLSVVYQYSDSVLCLTHKGQSCFGPPKAILNPQMLENIYGTEIKVHAHL